MAQASGQEGVARRDKITMKVDLTAEGAHSRATERQHDFHIHDRLRCGARDYFRDLIALAATAELRKGGEKLVVARATRERQIAC